ncbi:MAG TPA: NAD(+)/NADH kinase [Tepidisphaeraceae bacterium]|jgi:NAD+ kinase|nr:NAD(+)/NADH kinase [Tepidisphaeraceae bacterium]
MRILIVANKSKSGVATALEKIVPRIEEHGHLVGIDQQDQTAEIGAQADAILVLGGDGTLLSAARRLRGRQIPLLGVNFGRLGFLASFTPRQFDEHFDGFIAGKLPITARSALETSVLAADIECRFGDATHVAGRRRFVSTALNDAVITAGPPFHMIELEIAANGADPNGAWAGIRYFGDGVIVSTASGSTAYNVSAGGPIISPNVDAMCVTPVCPHSLSFRPVVVSSNSTLLVTAVLVNEGTTIFCDGQESTRLMAGERVVIRKSEQPVLLVENPQSREWHTLAAKLNWAANPAYNSPRP